MKKDISTEQVILSRLSSLSKGRLNVRTVEAIFLEIFAVSRNIELPKKITYLGSERSFTHQTAESRFGVMSEYMLNLLKTKLTFRKILNPLCE
jgi:chorismate mutase / prephenate dehydratase